MHKKSLAKVTVAVFAAIIIGVIGYVIVNNRPVTPVTTSRTPENWQLVDANSFTISLPPSWKFNTLQGIDSYVAEFVGDGVTLNFDYGWYSNPLADESDSRYVVTYETIDGKKAKIVVPKDIGNGTTGVYFEDVGDGMSRLQISG